MVMREFDPKAIKSFRLKEPSFLNGTKVATIRPELVEILREKWLARLSPNSYDPEAAESGISWMAWKLGLKPKFVLHASSPVSMFLIDILLHCATEIRHGQNAKWFGLFWESVGKHFGQGVCEDANMAIWKMLCRKCRTLPAWKLLEGTMHQLVTSALELSQSSSKPGRAPLRRGRVADFTEEPASYEEAVMEADRTYYNAPNTDAAYRAVLRASVMEQLDKEVAPEVGECVWHDVKNYVEDSAPVVVRMSLEPAVRYEFRKIIGSLETDKDSQSSWSLSRHFSDTSTCFSTAGLCRDAGWLAFYDYFLQVGCGVKSYRHRDLNEYVKSTGHHYLSIIRPTYAISCQNPVEFSKNGHGFHKEQGYAIRWADGSGLHFLNGVHMPVYVVQTPAEKLDPRSIVRERNAEVRREIVRRVGMERILNVLGGDVIDRWVYAGKHEYELIVLKGFHDLHRPPVYLKMKNPSIEAMHLEAVPPTIRTCKEALAWRCGDNVFDPEQLT